MKILVVDDDKYMLDLEASILIERGEDNENSKIHGNSNNDDNDERTPHE